MLVLAPGPAAALSTADEGSSCSLQAVYATTCHLRSTVQQNKGSFRHLIVVGNRLFLLSAKLHDLQALFIWRTFGPGPLNNSKTSHTNDWPQQKLSKFGFRAHTTALWPVE